MMNEYELYFEIFFKAYEDTVLSHKHFFFVLKSTKDILLFIKCNQNQSNISKYHRHCTMTKITAEEKP